MLGSITRMAFFTHRRIVRRETEFDRKVRAFMRRALHAFGSAARELSSLRCLLLGFFALCILDCSGHGHASFFLGAYFYRRRLHSVPHAMFGERGVIGD